MTTDNTPPEEQQASTSLSPVEVEGPTFDLEAAAFNKGNGAKLVGLTVACAALIGVSVLALGDLDSRHAFVEAGTVMNKLHKSGYERYWNCALIGMNQSLIESGEELEAQIDKRATHFGHSYGTLLRKCGSSLDSLERDLDTLPAPKSLREPIQEMRAAVSATRHASQDMIELVEREGANYRTENASPQLLKMARAWEKYRESHILFRNAIREQL